MLHVLIATDLSETSTSTRKYVLNIIEPMPASVHFVHVVDRHRQTLLSLSRGENVSSTPLRLETEGALQKEIQGLSDRRQADFTIVDHSYPSEAIAQFVATRSFDLVCMGLRQKYSLTDRFIGTVTARTIDLISVPTLVVPNGAATKKPQRILALCESQDELPALRQMLTKIYLEPQVDLMCLGNASDHKRALEKIAADAPNPIDMICCTKTVQDFVPEAYASDAGKYLHQRRIPLLLV